MEYYVGIDVGTSSLKSMLVDENGQKIAVSSRDYQFCSPCYGYAEQDPDEWWNATITTIQEVLAKAKISVEKIAAIGFSGQMHGLVALDASGKPVRPAILHCDTRSCEQIDRIKEQLGNELIQQELMNPVFTGFLLPSLLWIKDNEPENYARIAKVCLPKDYLKFKITGEIISDYSDAGATLVFDLKNADWNWKIIDSFDLPREWFPKCASSYVPMGQVTEDAARQTGLCVKTLVASGGGDQAMQRLGNGGIDTSIATINIGTSGQICFQSNKPVFNAALNTNMFYGIDENVWIAFGAMRSAGLCLKWWQNIVKQNFPEMDEEAKRVAPGSGGLVYLPYLNGERSPHINPNISGMFFGLNMATTRASMSRAVMEGVVFALYQCYETCQNLGLAANTLLASGGGARSELWRQIQADVFDLPLKVTQVEEQACMGACICAAICSGKYSSPEQACRAMIHYHDWIVQPNTKNHIQYEEYYNIFKEIYVSSEDVLEKITLAGRKEIN